MSIQETVRHPLIMYSNLLSCLALLALTAASPLLGVGSPQTTSAFVDLGYAQYQGTHLSIGVNQFLSMRYAAPPMYGTVRDGIM